MGDYTLWLWMPPTWGIFKCNVKVALTVQLVMSRTKTQLLPMGHACWVPEESLLKIRSLSLGMGTWMSPQHISTDKLVWVIDNSSYITSLYYESRNLTLFKKNTYQLPMAIISGNNFVFHSLSPFLHPFLSCIHSRQLLLLLLSRFSRVWLCAAP